MPQIDSNMIRVMLYEANKHLDKNLDDLHKMWDDVMNLSHQNLSLKDLKDKIVNYQNLIADGVKPLFAIKSMWLKAEQEVLDFDSDIQDAFKTLRNKVEQVTQMTDKLNAKFQEILNEIERKRLNY